MKINKSPIQLPPQNIYRPPIVPQMSQENGPMGQMQAIGPNSEQDFIPLGGNDQKTFNSHIQYSPQQMQPYIPQISLQEQQNWMSRQSNQMPVQMPPYEGI